VNKKLPGGESTSISKGKRPQVLRFELSTCTVVFPSKVLHLRFAPDPCFPTPEERLFFLIVCAVALDRVEKRMQTHARRALGLASAVAQQFKLAPLPAAPFRFETLARKWRYLVPQEGKKNGIPTHRWPELAPANLQVEAGRRWIGLANVHFDSESIHGSLEAAWGYSEFQASGKLPDVCARVVSDLEVLKGLFRQDVQMQEIDLNVLNAKSFSALPGILTESVDVVVAKALQLQVNPSDWDIELDPWPMPTAQLERNFDIRRYLGKAYNLEG